MSDRDDTSAKAPRIPRAGAVPRAATPSPRTPTPVPPPVAPAAGADEMDLDFSDVFATPQVEAPAPVESSPEVERTVAMEAPEPFVDPFANLSPGASVDLSGGPGEGKRSSLFGDLALGDDELDGLFGAFDSPGDDGGLPALDIAPTVGVPVLAPPAPLASVPPVEAELAQAPPLEDPPALEVEPEPALEVEPEPEVQAPEIEASIDDDGDDAVVLEAGDDSDEADVELGTEEELLEVEGLASVDRGAALAAAVTSRRRDEVDLDAAYALDAAAEVRARVELLVGEAAVAESFVDAADWYAHASDLLDGALGESARAEQLAERARTLAPEVPLALRVRRRLMLASSRGAEAAKLTAEELAASPSAEEREVLRWLHAFASQSDDADAARAAWSGLASQSGSLESALATMLEGASRRDGSAIEAGLDAWAAHAGASIAGNIRVAQARMSEGRDAGAALDAARAATAADASDLGAWLTMARQATARGTSRWLLDALAGVGRLSEQGGVGGAAAALGQALASLVGEPVTAAVPAGAGVGGRLIAHARELARMDSSEGASEARGGGDEAAVRRLLRALQQRREGPVAQAAAALFADGRASVAAGLQARAGSIDAVEAAELDAGTLGLALRASSAGEVSLGEIATGEGEWSRMARAEAARRSGEDASASFGTLLHGAADRSVAAFASRALIAVADPASLASALHVEAVGAEDPRRIASLLLLAAATATDAEDVDLPELRRLLPGDVVVAELAAQLGLRGLASMGEVAAVLAEVQGDPAVVQVAAIRSALRRSDIDHELAAQSLWDRWSLARADACLATLVLRTPGNEGSHAPTVARVLFERAVDARDTSALPVALGEIAAEMLEFADRRSEALQVLARTRALAPADPLLAAAEQSLLLASGRDVEVSERAFELLKGVSEPADQIEVFERLARIDLFERGDLASAVLSYAAILELDPTHAESLRAVERHYAERERWDELFLVLRQIASGVREGSDALPLVHAAGRVAERAGDDARAAAVRLRWETFDRGLHDRRLLMALDADVRIERSWTLVERLARALAASSPDPAERAAHWTRVALAAEATGELTRAADAYASATEAQANVATLLGSARLAAARGDLVASVAFTEGAALGVHSPGIATDALASAAAAWRDLVKEPTRALAAAVEALRRDPGHEAAFGVAASLLESAPQPELELELIAAYLGARANDLAPAEAVKIYLRGAGVAERAGDIDRARTFLRAVNALEPENAGALRALVRLSDQAEDWSAAVDARIRLAKTSGDGSENLELLLQLGDLFESKLNDPKRAEAAWRRVAQAAANDPRPWERLARFYERTSEPAREVEARKVLLRRARTPSERVGHGLRLAAMGRGPLADKALVDEALKACADDVRSAVDRNVRDVEALQRLATWLRLSGSGDGERVVAAAAVTLGVANDALRALAPDGVVAGAGAESLLPPVLDLLAPPALPADLRELLIKTSTVLDPLAPFDPIAAQAERLGARPHGLRAEIERWARMLDLGEVEIFLTAQLPALALPVGRSPAQVLVAFSAPSSIITRFAVARAALLITQGLSLPLRMDLAEFKLTMAALLRQFEPMFKVEGVDPTKLDALSRAITRAMPRELHAELTPAARAVLRRPFDAAVVHGAALEFGDRIALLATGDLPAAIAALAPPGVLPARVIDDVPAAARLVRVALSDRFLEARRLAGFQDP